MPGYNINFNVPNLFGGELKYIKEAYKNKKISGDGKYTKKCHSFLEKKTLAHKALLTTSCTHALEMTAHLMDIKPGDEIILPSYTFVSTVNAFVLRGARPVFCEIREDTLNIDERLIPGLITARTKAIVVVHYAGIVCEMDEIMRIAGKHGLVVIEDAAQALGSRYKQLPAGGIGDLACLSFHETKNYIMGEGGALLINNEQYIERAEILREKGTNRSKFFRGEVDKYSWVDVGSSYLPSDINAAILWRQLELFDAIYEKRKKIFHWYEDYLSGTKQSGSVHTPMIPPHCASNYHMFYLILNDGDTRDKLMDYLKQKGILAVFHYLPLHQSTYYTRHFHPVSLPVTEQVSNTLLRLPFYYTLSRKQVRSIARQIHEFFATYH